MIIGFKEKRSTRSEFCYFVASKLLSLFLLPLHPLQIERKTYEKKNSIRIKNGNEYAKIN